MVDQIPAPSSRDAATRMRAVRRSATTPEQLLERELRGLGLRFSRDSAPLRTFRRRGDFVFRKARVVVLVDGCFWHCCPIHATYPKANAEWWREKLAKNVARDRETDRVLRREGWTVIRVWEHEDMTDAARRVRRNVRRKLRDG